MIFAVYVLILCKVLLWISSKALYKNYIVLYCKAKWRNWLNKKDKKEVLSFLYQDESAKNAFYVWLELWYMFKKEGVTALQRQSYLYGDFRFFGYRCNPMYGSLCGFHLYLMKIEVSMSFSNCSVYMLSALPMVY